MELVAAGNLGRKTGRGFYAWVDGKPQKSAAGAVPDGTRRPPVGPFVAEAKSALAEHIVADADLVDAGAIFGTGFAPFRGGPLHYAATASLTAGATAGTASGVAIFRWTRRPTHGRAPSR